MPIATIALKVWQWRFLATSVAIVACLGACGSGWKSLGEQHAVFADALGVKGVRFGAEFDAWARGLVDDECLHLRPEASRLEPAKKQQLELFRSKFCRPWLETWDSSLKVRECPPTDMVHGTNA